MVRVDYGIYRLHRSVHQTSAQAGARTSHFTKAGEKEGFEQGLLLAKQVIRLAKEGHSVEEMAEICGIPAEKIREITED